MAKTCCEVISSVIKEEGRKLSLPASLGNAGWLLIGMVWRQGDEQEFTAAVKKHLTDQLSRSREDGGVAQALQSSENDSASIANALRR